jgi:hypothetical protein
VRLDHLSYVASHDELVDVVQRLGSVLGASFVDGGIHPRFGTRNFILPLKNDIYIEVVCPLDHPATDAAPFGQAVKNRADLGGGWLTWVCGVDEMTNVESRLGRESVEGHRRRPDGFDLKWRQIGVLDVMEDPALPFFIQWLTEPDQHPSRVADSSLFVTRLEIAGDPDTISAYLGETNGHPLDDVEVTWLDPSDNDGDTGLIAVHVSTPNGVIRLD